MLALRTARIQLVPSPCFASTRIFVRTTMSDAAVIRSYNQDGLRNWFGRGLNSRSEVGVNLLGRVSLSKACLFDTSVLQNYCGQTRNERKR